MSSQFPIPPWLKACRLSIRLNLTAIILVLSCVVALNQIPRTTTFQGVLTGANGTRLSDGEKLVTFKLYTDAGMLLWDETQSVTITNGVFNILLGSTTPIDLPFDRRYFLSITIDSTNELVPWIPLSATPYSRSAEAVYGKSNVFPSEGNVGIGTGTNQPIATLDLEGTLRIGVLDVLQNPIDVLVLGTNNIVKRASISNLQGPPGPPGPQGPVGPQGPPGGVVGELRDLDLVMIGPL